MEAGYIAVNNETNKDLIKKAGSQAVGLLNIHHNVVLVSFIHGEVQRFFSALEVEEATVHVGSFVRDIQKRRFANHCFLR